MEVWADRIYGLWQNLWRHVSCQLLLKFGVGVFLIRNLLLPLVGDDYSYAFIWDGAHAGNLMDGIGERQRITSLTDIAVSQWSHYFTWGGRVPALSAVQFFAWQGAAGKYLFGVVNTMFFVLLLLILYWLAVGKVEKLKNKAVVFWLLLGLFFAVPAYLYTMVWLTGACVYLWTAVAECGFLLPYAFSCRQQGFGQARAFWYYPAMFLLGMLAGWSVEPGSIVTLLLTIAFLYVLRRQKRLTGWHMAGFAGLMAGVLLLFMAPGSYERVRLMQELAPDYTMPPELLWTPVMFMYNFVEGFLPVISGELPLFIPIFLCLWQGLGSREEKHYILLFTAGSILVLCAMMFSPDFRAHGGYHSVIFLLVASCAALRQVQPWLQERCAQVSGVRLLTAVLGFGVVGMWLVTTALCLIIETSYRQQWQEREQIVAAHRADDLIVVPAIEIPWQLDRIVGNRSLTETLLLYGADLESDPQDNRSNMFAQYYGLKGIIIDQERDWGKYGEENEW